MHTCERYTPRGSHFTCLTCGKAKVIRSPAILTIPRDYENTSAIMRQARG